MTATPPMRISTDKAELDQALIHRFLSTEAYWSRGIPLHVVQRAIDGSMCFGGFVAGAGQVAFARAITDGATFAYLADVFVLPEFRGRGYSRQLISSVMSHPQLQGLRRFLLATCDAHGLYAQFDFVAPAKPQNFMEIARPNVYLEEASA